MKYATLTFNRKVCIFLLIELKVIKLEEGICNARLIEELEYVW